LEDFENNKPNPDELLASIKNDEAQAVLGKLKIFLGMCAGVGKTYSMLQYAQQAKLEGKDVVIGIVETHKRQETEELLQGLEIILRKNIEYKGISIQEMDLDAILTRKPGIVLVDELAHTNIPGSRHTKRYQDVLELLDNGINVFTTLNVQHIDSRTDTVSEITGIRIHETVPDSIVDLADEIELVDLSPEDLLKRLAEGKVYVPDKAKQAVKNFFRIGNLTALREMALRLTAERVDRQLRDYMQKKNIVGPWKSGERLLVAIGPSPYSANLIRWTRRLASTMSASWLAVYVQTSKPLSESSNEQLSKNISLAQELGADVIRTSDEDIVQGLLRIARQKNVSQIIIGKPIINPIVTFFKRKDYVSRLITESGDIDIYVVRGEKQKDSIKERKFFPEIKSGIKQYLFAVLAIGLVACICFPFTHIIGYQTVGLLLLLTISLLPLFVGRGPILLAAIVSSITWNYFFIPPIFTFHIERIHDIITLVVNFSVALVMGFLSAKIRAQQKAVKLREETAVALYNFTDSLSKSNSKYDVIENSVNHISEYFNAMVSIFLVDEKENLNFIKNSDGLKELDAKEMQVAVWSLKNGRKAGKYTDNIPSANGFYIPLFTSRGNLGVLGIQYRNNKKPSVENEVLLNNFSKQIINALESAIAEENSKEMLIISESEKLYKTLLNSISHELKTPLSIITGASSSLIDSNTGLSHDAQLELCKEINYASSRLNRLVENLLDITRLESGMMKLNLEWCDINDLLSVVLNQLKKELSNHKVIVESLPELPLIKLDFVLFSQALLNIIQNAATYTPSGTQILIKTEMQDKELVITIQDNGAGFPEEALPHLFDKFYRLPGTKTGGTGLGLSISKGFVEAHGGKIYAENIVSGGARFIIKLNSSDILDIDKTNIGDEINE
jgi:two-component system sensor histidine kinase KdpD